MTHDCVFHPDPSRRCYWAHRCRCDGCRADHAAYESARKAAYLGPPWKAPFDRPCAVDGCERDARSRGWCRVHYDRWLRTGTVHRPPSPPQTVEPPPAHAPAAAPEPVVRIDDLAPFVVALEAHARRHDRKVTTVLGDPDAQTWRRVQVRGWMDEPWADRIACEILGNPLELYYPTLVVG